MFRGILLCLLLGAICGAQTFDEEVRSLGKAVAARLGGGEVAHLSTVRNLASLGSSETARARAVFEHALRQSGARTGRPVEVAFTISQNAGGLLFIAEIERGEERQVEMVLYTAPPAPARASHAPLDKRLLWEQDSPMLDVGIAGDAMIVLEPLQMVSYARRAAGWERADAKPLEGAAAVRDPRGELRMQDDSFTALLPGAVCRGVLKPALDVHCESAAAGTEFTPARNTLQVEDWPPVFSFAQVDERSRPLYLTAELDGRTHLYDSLKKPAGAFDMWGDDFAAVLTGCGAGRVILASSPAARDAADSVTAFEIVDRKPVELSDPAEFSGPVTALWPAPGGAVAIARDLATGRYAAYSLTLDCGR